MKLNSNLSLMILLIFIISYCCLGDMLREGFDHHDAGKPGNPQKIETPVNDYIKGISTNKVSPDYLTTYQSIFDMADKNIKASEKTIEKTIEQTSELADAVSTPPRLPNNNNDLYILKSQIVPPVCPVCPSVSNNNSTDNCQPCPPCARCPEPAFECKKVPNYNSNNVSYLPKPLLNDFSSF
jgi:hypothetical protein